MFIASIQDIAGGESAKKAGDHGWPYTRLEAVQSRPQPTTADRGTATALSGDGWVGLVSSRSLAGR